MLTGALIVIGVVVLLSGGAHFVHRHSLLGGWW